MKDDFLEKLYHIAVMYYEEKMTQEEIARRVGMSRPQVSRALSRAVLEGIVEIKVNPVNSTAYVAEKLREKLSLARVYIAPVERNQSPDRKSRIEEISSYAASVIGREIRGARNIGLGWGETLYKTIMKMEGRREERQNVVPLVGSIGYHEPHYQVNVLVGMFSDKIQGSPLFYNGSESGMEPYKELTAVWKNLDVAVVGLGPYPTSRFPKDGVSEKWLEELSSKNPKGDILGRFFNDSGYIDEDESKVFVIPKEDLEKVEKVICLSGGSDKIDAIRIASKLGLITHLITDEETAGELMRITEEEPL